MEDLLSIIVPIAGRILLAIAVLIIGSKLVKKLTVLIEKQMRRRDIDASLQSFLVPLVKVLLQTLLIITIASMLGVELTSVIAMLGAASLAVGLALQGSLSNFAGGVLILMLKPFKVGDFIQANGQMGTVQEIQIFYTILNMPDNRKVIIPNANLSNADVVNYSANPTRRIEWKFGVGYTSDILQVKEILQQIVSDHPKLLADPEPMVVLSEHADSALVFTVRAWCNAPDYWATYFELMERVKLIFDEKGIEIPFPQLDVHMDK